MRGRKDTWVDVCLDFLREHRMPVILEVIVSWLVAALCLIYYGYSYLLRPGKPSTDNQRLLLMTEPRRNKNQKSETIQELHEQILSEITHLMSPSDPSKWNRHRLTALIRSNTALRRKVSRFMCLPDCEDYELFQPLDEIWDDLLRLPTVEDEPVYTYRHSLVIPAYREKPGTVASTLRHALKQCQNPEQVQVIVVDAGHCPAIASELASVQKMTTTTATDSRRWGDVQLVRYTGGGGRGPSQNFGLQQANGTVITFLHSDTCLPPDWDARVQEALIPEPGQTSSVRIQACAFSFGHNTSRQALDEGNGGCYPWGIRAVRFLGNVRASLCKLPYGDHVISVPTTGFRYIGGFPDQCIMEDYCLMDFLRKRAHVLPEKILIIPRPPALCSVRRWQKFGVVYTTLVNGLIVYRYTHYGWTPEDVYQYYYQRPSSKKQD